MKAAFRALLLVSLGACAAEDAAELEAEGRRVFDQRCVQCHPSPRALRGALPELAARLIDPIPTSTHAHTHQAVRALPGERLLAVSVFLTDETATEAALRRARRRLEMARQELVFRLEERVLSELDFGGADLARGRRLYVSMGCAKCHGVLTPQPAPRGPMDTARFIVAPRDPRMPSYVGRLSNQDLASVSAFYHRARQPRRAPCPPEDALYALHNAAHIFASGDHEAAGDALRLAANHDGFANREMGVHVRALADLLRRYETKQWMMEEAQRIHDRVLSWSCMADHDSMHSP